MKKVLAIVVAVALVLSFILPGVALAQPPLKVDKHKPVPATDVRLAAKVSVTRPGLPRPPKPPKPPRQVEAATGILGGLVTGGRYAIVIGISDYPGIRNDLKYMDDDAQDMISALTDCYGFEAANIISLIDKDGTEANGGALEATRAAIIQAIRDIAAEVTADDEVVFFFSGHGGNAKAQDGDNEKVDECIWAHDGSANLVPIWDGELKAEFEGYATSRIIFIFDSCYAGGMTDLQASGRVLAMATTENTVGYEVSTLKNGEFTYYLVDQGMLASLADKYDHLPGTADVTVEEAWDYAKANCQLDKPTIKDSFENDLLL